MKDKKELGKFILEKRKSAGLSQKELAEKLYVTESAVSKWERGVSYPDITMITGICETLGISEHELCIASEDHKQHEIEKMAKSFKSIKSVYSWILYFCYAAALIPCFICNIAINHTLSWFFIVLTSLMLTFSLLNIPVLFQNNKGIITLSCSYVSLLLLFMVCRLYCGGDWFIMTVLSVTAGLIMIFLPIILYRENTSKYVGNKKGLISMTADTLMIFAVVIYGTIHYGDINSFKGGLYCTIFGMVLVWIFFVVIRYLKINCFYKTSICLFVCGLCTATSNTIINDFIYSRKTSFEYLWNSIWDIDIVNSICALSMLGLGVIFVIAGIIFSITASRKSA